MARHFTSRSNELSDELRITGTVNNTYHMNVNLICQKCNLFSYYFSKIYHLSSESGIRFYKMKSCSH